MLVELAVRDLGVIAELSLVLGPGMTAITGETGAGKTLVVEALELLVGGRADPAVVRPGAAEALVQGRFALGPAGEDSPELVVARAVPATGRSRSWLDGRMAPVSALAEAGADLVELHGQHAHQSLLGAPAQRVALDAWAGIDHGPVREAAVGLREVEEALAALGGNSRARAREMDLLRFQVEELDQAALDDPDEDEALSAEEDRLAGATAHRQAALAVLAALSGDDGDSGPSTIALVGQGLAAAAGHGPLAGLVERLQGVAAEVADLATEARALAEELEDDPERLDQIRGRRQALRSLQRKYGDTLAEVMGFETEARRRLEELESWESRAEALEGQHGRARQALAEAQSALTSARRAAAPGLAAAVETHLRALAMPRGRLEVEVADGGQVAMLLGANPGEPALPLAKVASGGELARTMLATRLVLSQERTAGEHGQERTAGEHGQERTARPGPATLVFDEVDAGVGGEAALAVGQALAALARSHQVLVVTHLAQVAAFADHQVVLTKAERDGRTVAQAATLDEPGRVVELSRMLSGQPDSPLARDHARELLALAAGRRAPAQAAGRRGSPDSQRQAGVGGRRERGPSAVSSQGGS